MRTGARLKPGVTLAGCEAPEFCYDAIAGHWIQSGNLIVRSARQGHLSPHGMPTTHAEQINADLLSFIKAG